MVDRIYNVLFLCTGNSARSQVAECLLNHLGRGRFRAFSAGSHPKHEVHPSTLDLLRSRNHQVEGLRAKDWSEFAGTGAPGMDFVITVCDNAAGEVCPVWPGQPMTAHWSIADPAGVSGSEAERKAAFADVYRELKCRLTIFANLPVDELDDSALKQHLRAMETQVEKLR